MKALYPASFALIVGLACSSATSGAELRASEGHSNPVATIADVRSAWKAREEAIPRLVVKWKADKTYFKRSFPTPPSAAANTQPVPTDDVAAKLEAVVWLDGSSFRAKTVGPQYSGRTHTISPMVREFAFHERADRSLYQALVPGGIPNYTMTNCPAGFVATRDRSSNWDDPDLLPVFAYARPLSEGFRRIALDGYEVSPRAARIGDTECVVIRPKRAGGPQVFEYWLDPERGFVVRRFVGRTGGRIDLLVDIDYQAHKGAAGVGFVPAGWVAKGLLGGDGQRWQVEAEVVSTEFPDQLPEDRLTLQFPPGTLVTNYDDGTAHLIIKREKVRPVTYEEQLQEIPYQELLATEPDR